MKVNDPKTRCRKCKGAGEYWDTNTLGNLNKHWCHICRGLGLVAADFYAEQDRKEAAAKAVQAAKVALAEKLQPLFEPLSDITLAAVDYAINRIFLERKQTNGK